jgi:hypothetical protein
MAIRSVFWGVAGIFFMVSSANVTLAAVKKAPTGTATKGITTKGVPLTEAECTGLGGKVEANVSCKGNGCYTTDKDGVIHMACITTKK